MSLPASMRRAEVHGPGDLQIVEVPLPMPGPGEILLEIECALEGGTARKLLRRGRHTRLGSAPFPLGHEGIGRVVAVGEGVTRFAVGDRCLPANSASCGVCNPCQDGLSAQCRDMVWLLGTFATHVVVPAPIVMANAWRIPHDRDPAALCLAENLACVLKGHDRTPARSGERVAVLGRGPIGLLWIHVLAQAGAEVISVARSVQGTNAARSLGAHAVRTLEDVQAGAPLRPSLVVEAVGTVEAWETALDLVRPGGRVNVFGGPPHGATLALETDRLHYDELQISGSFHHTPYHFAEAVRRLLGGTLDAHHLLGERIGFDALGTRLIQGGPGKAILLPNA